MYGPSPSLASALRSRMLPNVPRMRTSWWPRRAPYELNSSGVTPCSWSHFPAGDQGTIEPAGEMWSVVTESPSSASTRASTMSAGGAGSIVRPSKYGGRATYVDAGSQSYRSPSGIGSARQRSSPSKTLA